MGDEERDKKRIKLSDTGDALALDQRFKDFSNLFFRLNTLYTFLICRKHVVPTFDKLKNPIETSLKRSISELDFARIAVILPKDCIFKYIDENSIYSEIKEFDFNNGGYKQKESDLFQLKEITDGLDENNNTQVLVFEFIDGNMKMSWTQHLQQQFNITSKVSLPNYTADEMKKMIRKRKEMFDLKLYDFIHRQESNGLDSWDQLTAEAELKLPRKKHYEDPIISMLNSKKNKKDNDIPDAKSTSIPEMIQILKKSEIYTSQIIKEYIIDERLASFKYLDFQLSPNVHQTLEYDKFYSHQADAINAINNGENVIITTSTSSGKSLIYQLTAIDLLLKNENSSFMYIFPTKALAQDQKRAFEKLLSNIPKLSKIIVDTYDGDTEQSQRVFIRKNARVIFTNPDMIHTSILPNHPNWRYFLYNLKLVVVDELHIYKGLFGSHVSLVMRRLRRLCKEYYENTSLQFISCSATLKEPILHMQNIFGIDNITLISEDGSPRGAKHLLIWNPPVLSQHLRKRENFIRESAKILVQLILNNVRTIAFCYVRRVCELLMKEVRNIFEGMNREDMILEVMSYRGGYSAADRRKIEREMFHGNLRAVISTNALELGIDIGNLDAVLMCGFPLSLANFHQQSGRAGRRNKDSLTLVVATDSPVDQHYVAHSEVLLEGDKSESFQDLVLDFNNILILEGHIQCAAFELPINIERDNAYFKESYLTKICHEQLQHNANGYHTHNRFLPWPSKNVSLRGAEEDHFAVIDITNGRNLVIEEIEASRTSFTLYDGGIFIHQGYPYLVKELNPDERYASVVRVDVDWITSQRDFTDVDPKEIEQVRSLEDSDTPIYFGKIVITTIIFGFFKVDKYKRIIDAVETHNPPILINSKGFWIDLPSIAIDICKRKKLNLAGAIHAAAHAIMGLLPRFIVAGVDEISTECKAPEKEFAERQSKRIRPARLVFFDSRGGQYGSGLSIKAFEHIDEILESSSQRVQECPCHDGCPNCVAASYCKEHCLVLSKPGALVLLHCILGHKEEDFIHFIKDGPEPNMPDIKIETVVPVAGHINFSQDFKIIDVRKKKDILPEDLSIKEEDNN